MWTSVCMHPDFGLTHPHVNGKQAGLGISA